MQTTAHLSECLHGFLFEHLKEIDTTFRIDALIEYCTGLGLEIPNKTTYAMASYMAPQEVEGCRQRMQRAIAQGRFQGNEVFRRLQKTIFERNDFEAYVIDDTGFAKQGNDSVGVQRQYSGTLGKTGNCQVAVTLHASSDECSSMIASELYLPEHWLDEAHRKMGNIPEEIAFRTKLEIALDLLKDACSHGAPKHPVLADAAYGNSRSFRENIQSLGLDYAVGVQGQMRIWRPGAVLGIPEKKRHRGRQSQKMRDLEGLSPICVSQLAEEILKADGFQSVTWRVGRHGPLHGLFYASRVQTADNEHHGQQPSEPVWLLIEHLPESKRKFKYALASFPEDMTLKELVKWVKARWRVEYDYREMKQHLGLDSYKGRSWGGFHRHLAMVALMHAFVSLHREAFSPSAASAA